MEVSQTHLMLHHYPNHAEWTIHRHHVFRDLRPNVCTFEECQNAGKLYVSRRDWTYHELQIHRREYACKECHKICSKRYEMSTHLREHYGESILPAQLGVILDLCNRQVDTSDNGKDPCLICGEELPLLELQKHLATHMEDLALFVLPNTNEEEEPGGSGASLHMAKLKSKSKTSDIGSEASSLGFSIAGDHGQTPAEFTKIFTSKETGYISKFLSWRTTDKDQKALDKGLWEEAENLEVQMMETRKTKLGADHTFSFLFVVNELADPPGGGLGVRMDQWGNILPPHNIPGTVQGFADGRAGPVFRYRDGVVTSLEGQYFWARQPNGEGIIKSSMLVDPQTNEWSATTPYATYTVFHGWRFLPFFWMASDAVITNSEAPNSMQMLYRLHFQDRREWPGLSEINAVGYPLLLFGRRPSWIASLVPKIYANRTPECPLSVGLAGELPVILGLMALSQPRGHCHEGFKFWQNGYWTMASEEPADAGIAFTLLLNPYFPTNGMLIRH